MYNITSRNAGHCGASLSEQKLSDKTLHVVQTLHGGLLSWSSISAWFDEEEANFFVDSGSEG